MSLFSGIKNIFKRKDEAFLILDIGGSSVKAGVVKPSRDKVSVLSFYKEYFDEEIFNEENINYENLRLNVLRAKFFAEKKVKVKIKKIVIALSEEFVKSLTLSIKHKREDPQAKINVSEIQNILLKVRWQFKEKIKNSDKAISIIEAAIQEVLIDGWRVANPIGFNGKELTLNIYYSYLTTTAAEIFDNLAKALNLNLTNILSKSYSTIIYELSKDGPNLSAIFMNLSTHRTDLFLVERGKIIDVKSFSIGSNSLTKKIADELGIGFFEAENIKLKYSRGSLSERINSRVKSILERELSFWLNGSALAIKNFSLIEALPPLLMIYGGGADLADIEKVLLKADWTSQLDFEKKPEIKILKPDFEEIEDLTLKIDKNSSGNVAFFSTLWRLIENDKDRDKLEKIFKKV